MRKGRILHIRPGVNPNSSSIGTDLSVLLIGVTTATVLVNLLDAALRLWLGRRRSGAGAAR